MEQSDTKRYPRGEAGPNSLVQVDGRQPVHLLHLVHHQVEFRTQMRRAGPGRSFVEEAVTPLRNVPQVGFELLQILLHALWKEGTNVKGAPKKAEKSRIVLVKGMGMKSSRKPA